MSRSTRRLPVVLAAIGLVATSLALLLGVFGPVAPAQAQGQGFPDVSPSFPAYDAICFLSGAGIISGYKDGTFRPGDTLKRAQATKMLVIWREVPPVQDKSTFPDVDDLYRPYVEAACAQGWISGFPSGRFKPYDPLTRQQMAIIMVRVMGWEKDALAQSSSQVRETLSAFSDWQTISETARPYVAMAVSKGLFAGSDGCYMPSEGITRAQFCLVVMRAELSLRATVQGVRSSADYPDKTRVVIDLSRAPGTVTASASPDGLLTIDYTGGAVAGNLTQAIASSTEVASVSATQLAYQPRTVRLTLKLKRYQSFRVMSLAPAGNYGYRIAVDVMRRTTGPDGDGPPLICLDPGHGGSNTGAIGVSGTPEKTVNLAMALRLADVLRAAGLRVLLTRETDCDVDLHQRAAMANTAQATVFVSIHNNASGGDTGASGTETYYRGTKEQWDEPSRQLALAIQRNLVATLGSKDRGAKTHWLSLVVLTETTMPAALVEVGFMDNAEEEAKLLTPEYQLAAAQGIAKGVLEYLGWSTTVYSSEQ